MALESVVADRLIILLVLALEAEEAIIFQGARTKAVFMPVRLRLAEPRRVLLVN